MQDETIESILELMKKLGLKAVWINNNGDAAEFVYNKD